MYTWYFNKIKEISGKCKRFFENKDDERLENVNNLLIELDKFIWLFRKMLPL